LVLIELTPIHVGVDINFIAPYAGWKTARIHSRRGPMKSVPPRGSGWVRLACFITGAPARYREVVLTSWDRGKRVTQHVTSAISNQKSKIKNL